jgi:selT/selW/selH-like putative selenoprotein
VAAELRAVQPDLAIEFIESSGGVFEIIYEGKLIFSKRQLKRFPKPGEVVSLLS